MSTELNYLQVEIEQRAVADARYAKRGDDLQPNVEPLAVSNS